MESSYITSAAQAHQLPKSKHAEIALIGRSNCGKSSLINALLGRIKLARVSNTPGRTQMVNLFEVNIGAKFLTVADLPGYGYAKAPQDIRKHWQELIDTYLQRQSIVELLFLIDARRAEELKDDDIALLKQLLKARPKSVTLVMTKMDKLNAKEKREADAGLAKSLRAAGLNIKKIAKVSTLAKTGLEELRQAVILDRLASEPE